MTSILSRAETRMNLARIRQAKAQRELRRAQRLADAADVEMSEAASFLAGAKNLTNDCPLCSAPAGEACKIAEDDEVWPVHGARLSPVAG